MAAASAGTGYEEEEEEEEETPSVRLGRSSSWGSHELSRGRRSAPGVDVSRAFPFFTRCCALAEIELCHGWSTLPVEPVRVGAPAALGQARRRGGAGGGGAAAAAAAAINNRGRRAGVWRRPRTPELVGRQGRISLAAMDTHARWRRSKLRAAEGEQQRAYA
eukprot:COSAG01_NODE_1938_length_8848_cov_17.798377_13_plen_162_part_00